MAGPFTYLGGQEMHYHDYLDGETGKMLIAVPRDEPYSLVSVDPSRFPVPPTDGRWESLSPDPPAEPASLDVFAESLSSEPANESEPDLASLGGEE